MGDKDSDLCFVPQKDLIYNKLLPYASELKTTSELYLVEIKTNLGTAILRHDIVPSAISWANHLSKYIQLYGHKFSKDDHVSFIRLMLDLLIIPELELYSVDKIANVLISLLRKTELLSREDLVIPWKPLYQLYDRTLYSPYEETGMLLLPGTFENTMKKLIRCCRIYFSVESTQEILDELRPLMCPYDITMVKAIFTYDLFLSTKLPPHQHDQGFKLWFQEFMDFWSNCQNSPQWEENIVWLFSRLASDTIGYIDWEPYIPMIFTRLFQTLKLPNDTSFNMTKVQVQTTMTYPETNAYITWIVSMLGGGSSCQMHICRFFKALESYYHPSNNGRWVTKLLQLLHKLPLAFVNRLRRERYKKHKWETPVTEDKKLTDSDITEFVMSLRPVVLLSMFSKTGAVDCAGALRNLALLKPELIIPPVLEQWDSSLETLTEPHRLISSINSVLAVARCLVVGSKYYPEGPSHVLPLLMGMLPGIDANDIKKCMCSLNFIATFARLVLLVDCSQSVSNHPEMPQMRQELCLATVAFEEFVLQYMDRCFGLIESSSFHQATRLDQESERMSIEENITEFGITTTFHNILEQCSPTIFKNALDKLYTFVSTHILETKVSGKYAAHMCQCAAKVNPELACDLFVPHFSKLVLALTESEDILKEEKLDDELLFSLLVLSEVVGFDGKLVLKHVEIITKVLKRTLHLKCKEGYQQACCLLYASVTALTMTYTRDFCLIPDFWKACETNEPHTLIDHWGMPGDIKNLNIKYYIPDENQLKLARLFVEKFLVVELEQLKKWANEEITMAREELLRSLCIVMYFLLGASSALPLWEEEPLKLSDLAVPLHSSYASKFDLEIVNTKNGQNIRHMIVKVMQDVLNTMLKQSEDDTKSLFMIIRIFQYAMYDFGVKKEEFDVKWKSYCIRKKSLENKLTSNKAYTRTLLVYRTVLQHELHLLEKNKSYFTATHASVMKDLFRLSISHYAQVRQRAQVVLRLLLADHLYSYKIILPDLIEVLRKDPTVFHEEFKGVLYIIMGVKQNSLLTMRQWNLTSQLWPAMVCVKHSEKPSIINLLERTPSSIQQFWDTFQMQLDVPESVLEKAKLLWSSSQPYLTKIMVTSVEIQQAALALNDKNEQNKKFYYDLVNSIVTSIENGNLHWRQYKIAIKMLNILTRYDVIMPASAVKVFVEHLVHDTLAIRKIAITAMGAILKQLKCKHVEIEVQPPSLDNFPVHPVMENVLKGEKPQNFWLQYNSRRKPDSEDIFNEITFVHKTHIGFSCLPKPFTVYAPYSQQPNLDRTKEEMREEERPIFDCFSKQEFVDKLIGFFSLEDKKGLDKFSNKRFLMFKGLFRNFGDLFLLNFLNHIQTLTDDSHDSKQRCASELLAGLIRGSKHWNYSKTSNLITVLSPVLRTVLVKLTPETLKDWATCFNNISDSRDPNHLYWIFEILMEKQVMKVETASFLESSWLHILCNFLSQQEWRVFELLHRIYPLLQSKLSHPYPNVREKMGAALNLIFLNDNPIAKNLERLTPKRADFLNYVLPKLAILENNLAIDNGTNESESEKMEEDVTNKQTDLESEEFADAKSLLQTVCRWLVTCIIKSTTVTPPDVYQLLPVLCSSCSFQNDGSDSGFHRDCLFAIAMLGQSLLHHDGIEAAISTIAKIATFESKQSRSASVTFLQLIVFNNLFTIMHNEKWLKQIKEILLLHLHDKRIEVREAASMVLSGLLHCEVLKVNQELINMFKTKCRKVEKRPNPNFTNGRNKILVLEPEEMCERHAGVLGLCACINAFPYDVPDFMPDILVFLGDHLHDPQPIQTTIKKTLSNFRRTHYDNWRDHKLKFTEDQLAVVTDLLVSPSYYA